MVRPLVLQQSRAPAGDAEHRLRTPIRPYALNRPLTALVTVSRLKALKLLEVLSNPVCDALSIGQWSDLKVLDVVPLDAELVDLQQVEGDDNRGEANFVDVLLLDHAPTLPSSLNPPLLSNHVSSLLDSERIICERNTDGVSR